MNTTISSATEEINAFQHTLHPSAMRAYFVAHAPELPHEFWLKHEPEFEDYPREATDAETVAITKRNRATHYAAWEKAFFAWRLFYADQIIAALEAK